MMRRLVVAATFVVCNCAWASGPAVTTGDNAATKATEITQNFGLSQDKTECLLFDTTDKGTYFLLRVRENHTKECGCSAGVSPTPFFPKIRKRDGYTVTTAYDGEHYRPLKPHAKD